MRESFERSRTFHDSPRILKDLRANGEPVSRKRVIRPIAELMKRVKARGKNGVVARAIDFVPAAVAENAVG